MSMFLLVRKCKNTEKRAFSVSGIFSGERVDAPTPGTADTRAGKAAGRTDRTGDTRA